MQRELMQLAAWLLTFAVHSTLLIGVAWAVRRLWSLPRLEEVLYRVAIFGGVITASLAHGFDRGPLPGWHLGLTDLVAPAAPIAVADGRVEAAAPLVAEASPWLELSPLQLWLSVYGLVVVGLLGWRGLSWWRAHRALAARQEVFEPRLLAAVSRLRAAAGMRRPVRLSQHPGLRSPIAFGLLDAEICLPPAALGELGAGRQECVLAHEIAHLRGRDPWWQLAVECLTCLFFFQPLLFAARRRLRDLAEFRCDAWVVEQTRDRAAMAHTLVEVAGWVAGSRAAGGTQPQVVTMAHHRSPLHQRVRLILDGDPRRTSAADAWLGALLWLLLGGIGYALPAVHYDAAPAPATPVQRQLAALEHQIADLHEQLAVAWRRLEGRDQPDLVTLLRLVENQLRQVNEKHRALCREAAERAAVETNRAQLDSHPNETTNPK